MTTPAKKLESIESQLEDANRRIAQVDKRLDQLREQQNRLRRNNRNLNLQRLLIEYRISDTRDSSRMLGR